MQLSSSQLFSVCSSLSSHICCSTDTSPLHCSCLASGWVRRLILLLLDCDAEYWAFVTRKVTIIVNLSAQLIMFCKQIHEHKTLLDTHRNIHHHHQSQYTDVHFKVSNPVSFRMHVCRVSVDCVIFLLLAAVILTQGVAFSVVFINSILLFH